MRFDSKKVKSELIFWGILILVGGSLFLTNTGSNIRAWAGSLVLTQPSKTASTNTITLTQDWEILSTKKEDLLISELSKPIFISIWATWCPPCRSELPSILALHEKYKNKVDFLLISPDESIETILDFKKLKGYESIEFYTSLSKTPNELAITSYPTTFIINKDKKIILKSVGAHNWDSENVYETLNKLIEK